MERAISDRGARAGVSSAGLLPGGRPRPPEITELLASVDVDTTGRTSRQLQVGDVEASDLVLTMEREQLRTVALMTPTAWSKTFTLKEIARRGAESGSRKAGESIETWTARLHHDRVPSALLGYSDADDVADPYGGDMEEYTATMLEIDGLVRAVADLIWPQPAVLVLTPTPEAVLRHLPG